MANQEIINYLEKWKEKGHNLSSIKRNLLDRGFSEYEINKAAEIVFDPAPKIRRKKLEKKMRSVERKKNFLKFLLFVLGIIFLFAFITFLDYYFNPEPVFWDCSYNESCFILASEKCIPSNFTNVFNFEFFGVLQSTEGYYEIRGIENERCKLFSYYGETNITYSEEFKQELFSQGLSEEEIWLSLEEINEQYDSLAEYKNSTCYYPLDNFSYFVNSWFRGEIDISSSHKKDYNCTGSIYEI